MTNSRPEESEDLPAEGTTTPGPQAEQTLGGMVREIFRRLRPIFRRLGPLGPVAIIAASLPLIGSLALYSSMVWVAPWLRDRGDTGLIIYVVGFTIACGMAVLPTHASSAVGGFAFGFRKGGAASLFAVLGGSMIGYFIARRASGHRALAIINEQPKFKAVYDSLLGSSFGKTLLIITLLRIPPNSPFAVTNVVLAATRVHPLAYAIGTIVGIAPRTLAAVYIGAQMSEWSMSSTSTRWMMVGGIIVTIVIFGIIGTMANRAITRVTGGRTVGSSQ